MQFSVGNVWDKDTRKKLQYAGVLTDCSQSYGCLQEHCDSLKINLGITSCRNNPSTSLHSLVIILARSVTTYLCNGTGKAIHRTSNIQYGRFLHS
jgi:hypothetical protein